MLISENSSVRDLFQQRERDHLLSSVTVTIRSAVENLEVGGKTVVKDGRLT